LIVLDGIPFVGSLGDIAQVISKVLISLKMLLLQLFTDQRANGVILVTTNRGQKDRSQDSLTTPLQEFRPYFQNIL
jgi:hypothetical protein